MLQQSKKKKYYHEIIKNLKSRYNIVYHTGINRMYGWYNKKMNKQKLRYFMRYFP